MVACPSSKTGKPWKVTIFDRDVVKIISKRHYFSNKKTLLMICDKIGVVILKVMSAPLYPLFKISKTILYLIKPIGNMVYNWWMYNIETSIRSKYIEASRILMDSLYKVNGTTKDWSFRCFYSSVESVLKRTLWKIPPAHNYWQQCKLITLSVLCIKEPGPVFKDHSF